MHCRWWSWSSSRLPDLLPHPRCLTPLRGRQESEPQLGVGQLGGTSPLLPSARGPCQGEGRAKFSCAMNCGAFDYHTCLAT